MSLTTFRRRLLNWFDRHQRDLPWRHDRDPYRIWVSEVMLQQTTVAAVIPYFKSFVRAFPTIQHLAIADEQEVLHHWQGLGYYRRARHLHQAAQVIVNKWNGQWIDDPELWKKLPGVGRYILGAVLSQAFDRRMPIIEANSVRVLSRWFGKRGDPKSTDMQKWLWATAEQVLPRKRAGDFNQALMELGALVCTPTRPKCAACPIRSGCRALELGRPMEFPAQAKSRAVTEIREVAIVLVRQNRVLLAQRPGDAKRWASMWEFPQTEVQPDETHEMAATRWLKQSLAIDAMIGPEITSIRYAVTRFRMHMTVLEATTSSAKPKPINYVAVKWLAPGDTKDYPMSTAQRKIAQLVARSARQRRLF